ncbi:MAG TPA: alkaline phosphatase family protein, partial [Bacteroidia bacterium]|jgi:arylsulfatase A-like enzyme
MVQNGFWAQRSGDIYVSYAPGWLEYGKTGTSHGSPYPYDTHVPLLWYGWNIRPGSTDNPVEIPDIVATLSLMLDVQSPDGCTGHPISTLVK